MIFAGKYSDTFEMAFTQLLTCAGHEEIPWIDCAALRCFGFRADGAIESWFQPFISLPDAAASLADALAVKLCCWKVEAEEQLQLPTGCEAFLLGPLADGIAVPELRDSYYHGNGRFLFIKKAPDARAEVFDPRGFDGLFLPDCELSLLPPPQGSFCLCLDGRDEAKDSLKAEELLYRGLAYHNSIADEELRSLERSCGSYTASGRNKIALRYGVLNMVQQLDKVFFLSETCGWKTAERYRKEKQALFACALEGDISGLPEAVFRIWRILDAGR